MPWTETARCEYRRDQRRYASDLTDREWSLIAPFLPPYSTVQRYFYDWRDSGLLETMRFMLSMETRELEGREASPTAGVIDSQSVKTTESGGIQGYDAGKKIELVPKSWTGG